MASSCLRCASNPPVVGAHCPECGDNVDARLQAVERSPLKSQLLQRLRAATSGEFEVVREIGNGGMAKVYLANELALDRPVAIKVLSPLFSDYPEIVRRFHQEARTAAQLSHPHVVPVFAVYQGSGLCFFTMPFVEGPSLRQILHASGRLDLDEAMDYLRQAAAALAYAHEHGVVHRDVKPENMLLERSTGRLMLTDFGLAKALGGESLTVPGDMIGTPQYMAPEQCEGSRSVDGRSDQYSLALVAYELLTGEYPFEGEGLRELLMKRLSEEPPSLRAKRPDVPLHMSTAIQRALARNTDDRYPSIDAFIRALSGVTADEAAAEKRGRLGLLGTSLASLPKGTPSVRSTPTPQPVLSMPGEMGPLKVWVVRGAVVAAAAVTCYLAIATMSGSKVNAEARSLAFSDGPAYVDREPGAVTGDFVIAGPPAPPRREDVVDASNVTEPEPMTEESTTAIAGGGTNGANETAGTDGPVVSPTPAAVAPRRVGSRRSAQPVATGEASPPVTTSATGSEPTKASKDAASADVPVPGGSPSETEAIAESAPASSEAVTPPQALLERYRQALQDEDLRVVEGLHEGGMASGDARFLEKMFDTAEQIEAGLELVRLDVDGARAMAEVDFPLRYVLSKTKWSQQHTYKLRLGLVKGSGGWRIESSERR